MKRHIENLQGLLLHEIYKRYSSRSGTSLNAFIKKKLKESDSDIELAKNIKADLEELESKDILTWKAEPMEKKGGNFPESQKYRDLLGTTTDPKYQTFKNIYVEVKLTPDKGLDYAANYTNAKANLSNNFWIRVLTVGFLIITAAGVIVQMKQCSISNNQRERRNSLPKNEQGSSTSNAIQGVDHKTKTLTDTPTSKKADTTSFRNNPINKSPKQIKQ